MGNTFLQSKNIVITGGTSGIGYEFIKQVFNENTVSVIGRAPNRLQALRNEFPGIRIVEADLANQEDVERAADEIVKTGDPLDLLINNAAVQNTPEFLDGAFCYETIRREINVNLAAPAILTYLTLPALMASKGAIVLNINSGLALVPKTSSAVYCATKGGLNILSQSLANQFENTSIRIVQAFLPLVDTEMTKDRGSGKLPASQVVNEILAGLEKGSDRIDIGKVRLLRILNRLSPTMARTIMRKG